MTQEITPPVPTTSVLPPSVRRSATPEEARIQEVFPALVAVQPALANLAKRCIRSIVLAPVGWLLLAPLFVKRIAPFVCTRYTLTNRRLMIQRGLQPSPVEEIALADIDAVRLVPESVDTFYRSADLEIVNGGQVRMRLVGVSEPEAFRQTIVNTFTSWVPSKSTALGPFVPASAKT